MEQKDCVILPQLSARLGLRQGQLSYPELTAIPELRRSRIGSAPKRKQYYRASKSVCLSCSLKPKCTTAVVRKITRDINEDVRDRVRALANTQAFQQSRRERKKVEMRFAHMKRILKLDRFRLRGLSGVRDEVLLTATAQNLRRLARLLCRAPPPLAVGCFA
jgi:hypothetical protein